MRMDTMLVISRFIGETFEIGDDITVKIVDIIGDKVRIGIDAPRDVKVLRSELVDRERSADHD